MREQPSESSIGQTGITERRRIPVWFGLTPTQFFIVAEIMLIARLTFGLACLGMLIPQGLMAATPTQPTVSDVVLGEGGILLGRLIDGRGYGLPGRHVEMRRGGAVIVWMRTDQFGRFAVKDLPGGTYALVSSSAQNVVRAWAAGSAPPRTSTQVILVEQPQAVSWQAPATESVDVVYSSSDSRIFGLSPLTLTAVVGMAVGIPILVNQHDDDGPSTVGGAGLPASP